MLLSACGSKGDLYHGEEPKAEQNIPVEDKQEVSKKAPKTPEKKLS